MLASIEHGYLFSGKYIFNHDVMNCFLNNMAGNEYFSSRALGITETWDHIQLHPDLKPLWSGIIKHYKRIGLNHSHHVIWELDRKHLGNHSGYEPSVFYYGSSEHKNWGDNKWRSTVDFLNSKNNFHALANDLGIHVPKTECFNSTTEINLDALNTIGYPCYLKGSASGVGTYLCNTKIELIQAMENFSDNVPVQIQEEISDAYFINLQYRVTENDVIRLSSSEQFSAGFHYQDDRAPAAHEPWREVDSMAYWLREMGMQGIFSFKIAVLQTEFGLRFLVIECTPRYKNVTYAALIAQNLDIEQWRTVTLATRHRNFDQLDIQDIEYNQNTGEGAIIMNWGNILKGKLTFILCGSEEYQEALANELEARL